MAEEPPGLANRRAPVRIDQLHRDADSLTNILVRTPAKGDVNRVAGTGRLRFAHASEDLEDVVQSSRFENRYVEQMTPCGLPASGGLTGPGSGLDDQSLYLPNQRVRNQTFEFTRRKGPEFDRRRARFPLPPKSGGETK